ncbi:DoxX family protein [Nocardia sp. XZ_19_385]|uniref:DoxX family protein n=1 Tax=Nocardia sp. XZ_19_385 TaxID=2769488 RepID=UPI00188DEFA4|nr:DoxX family protein [Nocardia sp. XZ_19_385]
MHTAYLIFTVLAALSAAVAALIDVFRAQWVRENMKQYGVPEWTLYPLAVIKAAGAIGLLVGLAVPPLALAAALGLTLYFLLAVATILRARFYSHLGYPMPYLLTAAASAALFAAA